MEPRLPHQYQWRPRDASVAAEGHTHTEGRPKGSGPRNRFTISRATYLGAGAEVIAINQPRLTTHTFPPVELDDDLVRPKHTTVRS